MEYLVIEGLRQYAGRWEFDLDRQFTTREWGWLKRYTGYLPLTIAKGFEEGDPEIYAMFAVIALVRAHKVSRDDVGEAFEAFLDAPFETTIRLEGEAEPDDADPFEGSTPESSPESTPTFGHGSKTNSEPSGNGPSRIGMPDSGTSASPRTRLVT